MNAKAEKAVLLQVAGAFAKELSLRTPPGTRVKIGNPIDSQTGGHFIQIASLKSRKPTIKLWYDRYLDGRTLHFWAGFCAKTAIALEEFIADMCKKPEIGKHLSNNDAMDDEENDVRRLSERLPSDLLAKPIFEGYSRGHISCFGIYQKREARSVFIRRSADFIAETILALPEHMDRDKPLSVLRAKALAAATEAPSKADALRTYYQRSASVRNYVLARADGTCEACDSPAPFKDKHGRPYLEAHHIDRMTDGGPDDPRKVAATCPKCHREIHHGVDGYAVNARATANVDAKELELSQSLSCSG